MGNTDFKQLVFFWIEKYRNLRNAGFNFGSEYVFSVESVDGTLVVDKVKNEKYMPDFFLSETKKRVRNVSAIVGENGSGKSNLLSALRIVLANKSVPYFCDKARYILIFQTKDGYQYELNGDFIEKKDWGWLKSGNLKDIATVFYSPGIDFSNYVNSYPDIEFDVSSNVLLSTDHLKVRGTLEDVKDPVLFHQHQNTWRQAGFVNKFENSFPDTITLPKKMVITTQRSLDVDESMKNKQISSELKECFRILLEKFKKGTDKDNGYYCYKPDDIDTIAKPLDKVEKVVLYHLIGNFCVCFNIEYPQGKFSLNNTIQQIKPGKIGAEQSFGIVLKELTLIQKYNKEKELNIYDVNFEEPVLALWYKLKEFIHKDEQAIHDGIEKASFTIQTDEVSELIRLYNNYLFELNKYQGDHSFDKKIPSYNFGLLEFDWFELSHGEKAFLNLYSRFNYARELMTEKQQSLKNNVVILIDEGEAGFHLQWQKDYIDNLIKILPKIFTRGNSGDKVQDLNIQIIFTSHSPFSLSDIPNYNITYLESVLNPDGSKICKVLEDKERPQYSFAANIHTLMKHSFYLKNGLVGKFAVLKIEKVIKILNSSEKISSKKIVACEKLIELVDEPVLKQELIRMLYQKQGFSEKECLQKQIDYLQKKRDLL